MRAGPLRGRFGRFCVSCGDFSEVFELVEVPFDKISLPIERRIDGPLYLPVALCGAMAAPAMRCDHFEDGAGIAAAIGHRLAGRGTGCQKVRDGGLVRGQPR